MSLSELKKVVGSEKINFGKDNSIKKLKLNDVKKVFLAKNCPDIVKKEIISLAKINKIKVEELDVSNEELGVICKKPFFISVLSY